VIPAGILQSVFYSKGRPEYLNYGIIGSFIGHELTHGLDILGIQLDKYGNLADWWQVESKKEYIKRTKCIIDQYNNYTVEDVALKVSLYSISFVDTSSKILITQVNGKKTLAENLCDISGVKLAYRAYDDWETQNGLEPRLPGLSNYSTRQMFWIGYALLHCSKYQPDYLRTLMMTDSHSPNEFRTIGTLSNTFEFSKDFNCPLNSRMNPTNKCTLW